MFFLKKEDGFTLLEAIISIAGVAILSVFILQMFISAASLNKKAKVLDLAAANASSIIENFKASESLEDFQTQFLEGTDTKELLFDNYKFFVKTKIEAETSSGVIAEIVVQAVYADDSDSWFDYNMLNYFPHRLAVGN